MKKSSKIAVFFLGVVLTLYSQAEASSIFVLAGQSNAVPMELELSLEQHLDDFVDDFYIVKHAVGATSLYQDWYPTSGPEYQELKTIVAQSVGDVMGMFWMQGESDADYSNAAESYEANLTSLIWSCRNDFGNPEMPFIIGRIHDSLQLYPYPSHDFLYSDLVREAQQNVALADALVGMVDTDSFSLQSDYVHFDAKGLFDLGTAMAGEYRNITASIPIPDTIWLYISNLTVIMIIWNRRKIKM